MSAPDTELLAVTPAEVAQLDRDLAAAMYPHGARLECQACGKRQKASRQECERFAVDGWPACCNTAMEVTKRPSDSLPAE